MQLYTVGSCAVGICNVKNYTLVNCTAGNCALRGHRLGYGLG